MGKLTIGQKAGRVLTLLLGLRHPKIAAAMAKHGFTDEELTEGWRRLRAITRSRLDTVGGGPQSIYVDSATLATLDEWENKWFPITKATLKHNAPKVHEWMFLNLAQAEGVEVIITVGTFVERWDQVDKPKDKGGFGTVGKDAKNLLVKRGLTADVIDEARKLLQALASVAETPVASTPAGSAAAVPAESYEEAEKALWAWYLEWSEIARTVIKDRRLLRAMGFLKRTGGGEVEEEEGDEEEAEGDEEEAEGDEEKAEGEEEEAEEPAPPAPVAKPAAKPTKPAPKPAAQPKKTGKASTKKK